MGALFVYILKAAICLSAFYLFYRLLLSRETFHRFNRIAVLGILMISFLIPFCEVKVTEQTEVHQTVLSLEQLLLLADMMGNNPVVEVQNEKIIWVHFVLYIYLAGILFFTCRNLYSLIRLGFLLKSGERKKLKGKVTLIIHKKNDLAPFSWMKYVVISRDDLEENGREILIHELAHIHKRHSIDLLIADICIFFQWFNPAAWLLKQELQNIHEYEADETVIKEGIDIKQYQLLLIKKAVGTRLYSMANSFNHSKLKNRITMMLKEKSSPWARLKYLYVLPLAAVAVTAFARPEVSNELKEISKVKVNDLTENVKRNEVENQVARLDTNDWAFQKSEEIRTRYQKDNPDKDQLSTSVNARIYVMEGDRTELTFDITNDGLEGMLGDSATFCASSVTIVGDKPDKPVNVSLTVLKEKPLVYIDGKESTLDAINALDPNKIQQINVIKDGEALQSYGDKAKFGVILVELKKDRLLDAENE